MERRAHKKVNYAHKRAYNTDEGTEAVGKFYVSQYGKKLPIVDGFTYRSSNIGSASVNTSFKCSIPSCNARFIAFQLDPEANVCSGLTLGSHNHLRSLGAIRRQESFASPLSSEQLASLEDMEMPPIFLSENQLSSEP